MLQDMSGENFVMLQLMALPACLGIVPQPNVKHWLELAEKPVLQILGWEPQQACKEGGVHTLTLPLWPYAACFHTIRSWRAGRAYGDGDPPRSERSVSSSMFHVTTTRSLAVSSQYFSAAHATTTASSGPATQGSS